MTQDRRQPHADAAEYILNRLGELRPGVKRADVRAVVIRELDLLAAMPAMPRAKSIVSKASRANKAAANLQTALRGLLEAVPPSFPTRDVVQRRGEFIEPLREILKKWETGIKGGDPRRKPKVLACVGTAFKLVSCFSISPPVGTQRGNLHLIAQAIHKAVGGQPKADAGMLRMCREFMRLSRNTSSQ
jgi:hypothetical protein